MIAVCIILAAATVILTEWLRHRPHRLMPSTQYIALVGYSIATVLVGAALGVFIAK